MVEIEREEQLPQEVSSSGMLIGGERTILTKKSPLIARDGTKTLVGIIRDITERKLLQKQLEEQRARQIAASRMASLGEMAGGVAHEINNPLAIISGYAGRLSDVLNQNPIPRDKALDIVSRIDTTTIRIATIIKGLRAISRDGEFDEKEVVSLSVIVADTMSLCAERFISKGVYVETKVDPGLVVFCRSVQISQVLLNLLTNAFFSVSKSPGGNILIEAKLRGDWVEIAVTDSGEGVPAHHREKIFEPFFTTKPIGSGTGLGLSIGVSIVRDHGGELILDSNAEKTRFVFRLPVGPPKDNP
jgi:two-component system sensor histidine kinase DctS